MCKTPFAYLCGDVYRYHRCGSGDQGDVQARDLNVGAIVGLIIEAMRPGKTIQEWCVQKNGLRSELWRMRN